MCGELGPSRASEALGSAVRQPPNAADEAQPAKPRCPGRAVESARLQMSETSAADLHQISWVLHFNVATLVQRDPRQQQLSHGAPALTSQPQSRMNPAEASTRPSLGQPRPCSSVSSSKRRRLRAVSKSGSQLWFSRATRVSWRCHWQLNEDGPRRAAEYKHLRVECLVLFSPERLYTAAFFCRRPHPVLHASQGSSSSPWPAKPAFQISRLDFRVTFFDLESQAFYCGKPRSHFEFHASLSSF